MNRRGFISLLAGGAGATLVPWRALTDPLIMLPPACGWAARSITALWLDYANQIRPIAVLVEAGVDPNLRNSPWRVEDLSWSGRPGVLRLSVSSDLSPSVERRMRAELLKEPVIFRPYVSIADFAPWEFPVARAKSHIVWKS